jgi:O-antigen ligase
MAVVPLEQPRLRRSRLALLAPLVLTGALGLINPYIALGVSALYLLAVIAACSRRDAISLLSVVVFVLILIPSDLVINGLSGAGSPLTLVGLGCLVWWAASRIGPDKTIARGHQPIHVVLYLFIGSILASYAVAYSRILPDIENRAVTRGLVEALSWCGIALLCADGITSRQRLDTLLQRLVSAVSVLAGIGVLQFLSGTNIADIYKHIPGFSFNLPVQFILSRDSLRRVQGTAAHPIEFGVVLAMVLPIAIHYALYDPGRSKRLAWLKVALIAVGIPLSISRSAFIAAGVGGLILLADWGWRRRINALIAVGFLMAAVRAVFHGVLGTIVYLFTHLSTDSSVAHREQDLARVGPLISQYPVFGRGFGTFIPTEFQVPGLPLPSLDNQYLGTLVETGYVGLVVLIVLFVVFFFTARGARRRSSDPKTRHLAQALAASAAGAAISFYTFDALAFLMATGTVFLLLGAAGALWRLVLNESKAQQEYPTETDGRELAATQT